MREELCRHLRCPDCAGDLDLEADQRDGDHVMEGAVRCTGCGRAWPVRGGVPRFVEADLSADVRHTARNFGASWRIWRGIDDERYRRQLLEWLPRLDPEDVRGRTLLDAGCGKGRHLRVMAQLGAREIVGVDLSEAVDVAFANTRDLPNVLIVQADLRSMPVRPHFDLGYSVGVLHHTPDPGAGLDALALKVRPGGQVACWVYGRENNGWIIWVVNPIRKLLTRHLPVRAVRAISDVTATVLYGVVCGIYVPAGKLGIPLFYRDYMLNLRRLGYQETRHIVYDHLIAPTAFYLCREQVEGWFDESDYEGASVTWVNRNSWSGLARRRVAAAG